MYETQLEDDRMAGVEYSMLDVKNPEDVAAYERALYRAFSAAGSIVLDRIWEFDRKNRRAKTRVAYEGQEIYAARAGDAIIAAAAMNYDMTRPLQLEMIGFTVDKSETGVCEGLALFSLDTFAGHAAVSLRLKDYTFSMVRRRHIRTMYATCSQRRLGGYRRLGWREIDERSFERGKVFLLYMNTAEINS